MADAFLHRRSVLDKHKDAYGLKNPIKQMRVARSWDNPITRNKREKSLHSWANSFAGKRHYRKLSRHNALHLHEDADMNKVSIEEICDTLNRYAAARWLPFKADLLHGADGKHISLHSGNTYLDIGYAPSGELEVYDAEVAHPLNVLTHWDSVDEIAGHLLSLAVRQAAKNESVYEKLSFEKGHKDSKGNDAPWVIRSHDDGKVLASFANKDDAEQHLARMKNYSKKESFMSLKGMLRESHAKKLESFAKASESLKKNFRFKDPKSDDDLIAIQDIVYEINRRNESQAVAEKIGSELESLMESASRDPKWNEMSDEECARAMYKAAQPILSKITSGQLEEIFHNPGHDHDYFRDAIEYDEEAEEPEYRADDLYDFSSIRHESKCEWLDPEGEAVLKKQAPKLIDALNAEFKRIGSPARLELAGTDVRFSDGYYLPVKCSGKWDKESRMLNARLEGNKTLNGVKYYDGNIYLEKGWRPTSFRGARRLALHEKLEKMGSPKHEAASRVVADNKLGKIVKARLRDNVLAFLPTDDDGKNDDCTYFFKVDGNNIITKGYHWGRDEIDRSMIADDGYPWTAEPNRPTRDYVHTKKYAKQLVDRVRKCLDLGIAAHEGMGEIIFEPVVNFKPQQYAVYEIDDDGDELECIFSGTLGSAKKKLGDAMGSDPNKKFHVVAIAYTPRGQLADSEVVWSDLKQELAPTKNESAEEGITSRDVQAAARSAWSTSGATDFKLDIVRLGDHIIIYAKGPNGEDNVGISWHVHIPSILNSYETPHVEQFAVDSKGAWPKEPERTFDAKDLDELENQLADEFEALQEAIDIGKEG